MNKYSLFNKYSGTKASYFYGWNSKQVNFLKHILFLSVFLLLALGNLSAQDNEDCFMCHDDPDLVSENPLRKGSLYIKPGALNHSVHKDVLCASCHPDAKVEDYPHPEKLSAVNCGTCHETAQTNFFRGVHGWAFQQNDKNAPDCMECHGSAHDIISSADPKSPTYKMNIPVLCGTCHKEGAPVSREYNITEHNIVENYSQGIHGKGLFNSGLIVTATCNDCHGNHLVLPHTNRTSSISVNNIANTCMKCHARIEDVHTKVINKEQWEKKPEQFRHVPLATLLTR